MPVYLVDGFLISATGAELGNSGCDFVVLACLSQIHCTIFVIFFSTTLMPIP
jgi:hypothetical protein